MNIAEERKENEKAVELFRAWTEKQFTKFQEAFAGNKSNKPEFTDEVLTGALMWNLRQLYDFFDENDVEISVVQDMDRKFYFFINDDENSVLYQTRQEAEGKAFKSAFSYLNARL